ncbi:pyridoxal phosphate-dependent aminotransferase [Maritalea sp.]|uniref:pyridoxal phosphate-dependent aminotransferase n=1 Tax=Maritalea sp. TaxID=2003361 RepID=UPI003EF68A7A
MTKSQEFDALRPFYAMEILAMAKEKEAQGIEISHLEVGEPGALAAPEVREAVARAVMDEGQGYTHAKGNLSLREGLVHYYRQQHKAIVDVEDILVTNGSSAGFILAFLAGFKPGAKIAVTRPGYPAYLNILTSLGFKPVEIELSPEASWRLSAEMVQQAYEAEAFDGLLLASPANPTGAMIEREDLEQIIEVCRTLGVRFISDEIYHGLSHGMEETSALEFGDDAIVINSFSKYYCMTGWRLGWMVLPKDLVRRTEIMAQNMFISAPSLSQLAGEVALNCRSYYDAQKTNYVNNGTILTRSLNEMGFRNVRQSDGAFYAYADISEFSNDSVRFCHELLERGDVAATPGVDFDRVNGHNFVRFSYAGSREVIESAIEKMAGFLSRPL